MPIYEWRCKRCETKYDALAKMDCYEHACPECGADSKRLISPGSRPFGSGKDPDMPTDYARWERQNKQKQAVDKKFHENHGTDKKHHSYGS